MEARSRSPLLRGAEVEQTHRSHYLHNIYKISTQYQRSLRPPPPGVNIRAPRDQQHRKCRTGSGGRTGSGSGYTLPDWAQGDWGEVQVAGGRLVYRDTEHFVQHTGQHTANELFWGEDCRVVVEVSVSVY